MTMATILRAGQRLLLALALITGATVPAVAATTKREGVWAQSYVDRAPDPAIRFGTLANGMRYAILHNATPPGQMALRLVIKAGSLDETDGEQGVAHFLEHMAFRGSTHVADGELMRGLQREGLAPGADSNAQTSHEATIYQFDFPHGGKESVATGLGYLREIASELRIDPKAVDTERGVVLSEERIRDGPGLRATRALLGFTLAGQRAPDRLPIGTIASVRAATAATLRGFYEAHYRPENATVIVVGDVDPAIAEAAIVARFADWRGKGPPAAPPVLGTPARRGEEVRSFSEAGGPTITQIGWVRRYDDRADTTRRTPDDFNRLTAQMILNQRLGDIGRRPDAPFIGAGVGESNVFKSANMTNLTVRATADRQLGAMQAAIDELRRARRYGITQAELDRALTELDAATTSAVAGASTRYSTQLANRMVQDVVEDEVTRSPAQDYDDFVQWRRTVGPAAIDAALKHGFDGSGPLIFLAAPQPPAGGDAAIRAAYDASKWAKVAQLAAAQAGAWPYTAFGPDGQAAARREIGDLGITLVNFANGVTLAVKPTSFAKGEVLVAASFGQGRLALPRDEAHAYWLLSGSAFVDGGTGKLDSSAMQRALAGHVVGARLQIADTDFALEGHTRPEDLALQLQLLAAYISDPGFRPEAVTRIDDVMATYLPQVETSPGGVLGRELGQMLHDGDPRWLSLKTPAQLAQTKAQDLAQMLRPQLGGPITLSIVGDVTVDQAVALAAKTFGALPPRPAWTMPSATAGPFPPPTATPVALTHKGRADQARAFVAWPATDFWTSPNDARTMQVIAAILQQRLFDTVREKEGSTYTPEVSSSAATTQPGYGFLSAGVEMPPEKLAGFFASVDAILADLRAKPVGIDELDRAKRPLIEARGRDLEQNIFWLNALPTAQHDPRDYDAIRTRVSGTRAVSAADVQRVANLYLRPERAFRVTVKPENK